MDTFLPYKDPVIPQVYSADTIDRKINNKLALQKELGWVEESKCPLLCLPQGMNDELGGKLLLDILPGILSLPVNLLIRGKGSPDFGKLFTQLTEERSHRVWIMPDEDDAVRMMYAASDISLFLTHDDRTAELTHCLNYAAVPVSPECPHLKNYDPVQESGNAFVFDNSSPEPLGETEILSWGCFAALVRALETYRLPFDFRTIQRHCMKSPL